MDFLWTHSVLRYGGKRDGPTGRHQFHLEAGYSLLTVISLLHKAFNNMVGSSEMPERSQQVLHDFITSIAIVLKELGLLQRCGLGENFESRYR